MRRPFHHLAHPLAETTSALLLLFLVLFPKGGLKLGWIPLTWGYALLGILAVALTLYEGLFLPWRLRPVVLAALLSLLPFQVIFLYSWLANGVLSMGFAISVATSFFLLPFLFLVLFPPFFPILDGDRFRRLFCNCITLAALWGVLLFVLWPFTHSVLEIPLLTVNWGDYGTIATTKHIYRGPFLKLISTYNNGNVYGVATLLLLPLYALLEPSPWRRNLLRVALFLTLARTVWIGLLAEQLLSLARPLILSLATFPRVQLNGTGRRLAILAFVLLAIVLYALSTPASLSFLLDPTFSGRIGELQPILHPTFLPNVPIDGFWEVLFASALAQYGIVGLLAFSLIFFFPFGLALLQPTLLQDPVRRMALKGLALYLIVAVSDGAANLIPVLAFFWFVYSVVLFGLPGTLVALPASTLPHPLSVLPTGDRPSPSAACEADLPHFATTLPLGDPIP